MTADTSLWEASLTSKLIAVLKITPILKIRELILHDERLKDHYKEYDPLAITLKLIDVIIDYMGYRTGITKEALFEKIIPLLKRMDIARELEPLSKTEYIAFLDVILEKLISLSKKEGLRLTYTDYSKEPPERHDLPIKLLSYRNYDDENVVLIAEAPTINFFLQMLDINLEDHQQALLHVISRQIERGEFVNALETTKSYIYMTKQYMFKVEDIINRTRRNINSLDWLNECREELQKSSEHIKECIAKQSKEFNIVTQRLSILSEDLQEERYQLAKLMELLKKSLELLLPLQTRVSEARDTFLDEQWVQVLFRRSTKDRIQFEENLLDTVLPLSYQEFQPLFEETVVNFSHCAIPHVFTFGQLLTLTLKQLTHVKSPKKIKKPIYEKILQTIDLDKYHKPLRKKCVIFLSSHLRESKGEILLSDLLKKAEETERNFLFCNYLRFLIQGRFAVATFEQSYLPFSVKVLKSPSEFISKYFMGTDYRVVLLEGENTE